MLIRRARFLPEFIPAALVVALGALIFSAEMTSAGGDDPSRCISPDTVTLHGTVAEVTGRSPRSATLLVECDSIGRGGVARRISGKVLVVLAGRAADPALAERLIPGRTIGVRSTVREIAPPRNPGDIDWRSHYLLAGVRARMVARYPGQVVPGPDRRDGFRYCLVLPARLALSARLRQAAGDREARYLNGLILGERNEVPSDLRADFITVGVMHLLAISGQQVVLVAILLSALLRVLRIPERPRFFLLACALAFYVLLTGASPSVTRAGIMAVVMLGGRIVQRRADIHNALGASAALILLADPAQLFDPGFLLSYSAVLSIVLFYPLVRAATPRLNARIAGWRVFDLAWKGAAVSLAAGLGTFPVTAWFFGRVSLVGFLANLLIVPLSSAALVLGMLAIAASFLGPPFAPAYAAGAEAAAWLTFRLVEFFAAFPHASVGVRVSVTALLATYGLMALGLVSASRRSWKPLLFGILFACNLLVYGALPADGRRTLRVTFLDVGQGDAAFVQLPGGWSMLIDGGPRAFSRDPGRQAVVAFLRHMGVKKLGCVVLSHPHGDHLGGILPVLETFPVDTIIECGTPGGSDLYGRFLRVSDSLGIPRRSVSAGERIGNALPGRLYVLAPEGGSDRSGDDLNNGSVTLLLRYGRTAVIFPGDAGARSEEAMAARYGAFLDADILKAGHHGSRTSSTEGFLRSVSPAWTVISAGEGNGFGHPSPDILARLGRLGSAVHRTDISGAAVFESDGAAWRLLDRPEWP